jgi:hypothetical protein
MKDKDKRKVEFEIIITPNLPMNLIPADEADEDKFFEEAAKRNVFNLKKI